jgi:hypothetical protein
VASAPAEATAIVNYNFTSTFVGTVGFSYTSSDFMTSDTDIVATGLDSCVAPAGDTCHDVFFDVTNGTISMYFWQNGSPSDMNSYGGFAGDFSSYGTYSSPVRTLVVSPQGVPEPATWALMLLGFAGIGFAMRQKKLNQIGIA